MRTGSNLLAALFLTLAVGCADSAGDGGGDDTDDTGDQPMSVDAALDIAEDGAIIGDPTLVDDFEDNEGAIIEIRGRIGAWYSFDDETVGGELTPASSGDYKPFAGGAKGSAYTGGIKGKGFKTWGAGFGVDFNNAGTSTTEMKKPWDASAYKGIAFEAKGNVPMRVSLQTTATVVSTDGGSCVDVAPPAESVCGDGFGKAITLGADWKTFEIPFTALTQDGWGTKATFDAKTLTGFMGIVGQNTTFDVSLDNLRFY